MWIKEAVVNPVSDFPSAGPITRARHLSMFFVKLKDDGGAFIKAH
jgi:hypothetical protein